MRTLGFILMIILGGILTGCQPAPESGRGFRLPDGDPDRGKQAFLAMQCNACHQIEAVDLPVLNIAAPVTVVLGGPVSSVKTYGELVTAIINPSHKLIATYPADEVSVEGETFMPTVNQFMTVSQLIDIVAFLQIQYDVVVPAYYPYSVYGYN